MWGLLSDYRVGDWHRHQFGEGESAGAAAGRGGGDTWRMPSQTGPGRGARGARGASCRDGKTSGSAEGGPGGHWVNEGGRKVGGERTVCAHPFPSSLTELYRASRM